MKRERPIVIGSLVLLVALAGWNLATGAGIDSHGAMAMPGMAGPSLAALTLMWFVMMVAMMVPSAAPAILLYGRVRASRGNDADIGQTWLFLAGYLFAWLLFSICAAALQQALIGPTMAVADHRLAAVVLIVAGAYQLSPLKGACLRQCRSPAQFISRHWRSGATGAVRLGILHGAYCVGCCWLLMALLFVGGVMNFAWITALTLLVAIEKLVPGGQWIGRLAGIALIAVGAFRLAV